jgi:hypothetical protein
MTTPSEERRRHLQFGCHHELGQRARDLQLKKNLLLAHQLNRVQVDYISVLGIHLGDNLVGIALRLPALTLEIQHLGVKDLGIPLPYYFQF